jgi:hypothetical protein
MGGQSINGHMVGIAVTSDGKGYWLAASDGGVFAFGDAQFAGALHYPQATANISESANSVVSGGAVTLSWSTTNASSANIDGVAVPLNGSEVVHPTANNTYLLTAVGAGGNGTSSVSVTVTQPTQTTTSSSSAASGLAAAAAAAAQAAGCDPTTQIVVAGGCACHIDAGYVPTSAFLYNANSAPCESIRQAAQDLITVAPSLQTGHGCLPGFGYDSAFNICVNNLGNKAPGTAQVLSQLNNVNVSPSQATYACYKINNYCAIPSLSN